MFDSLLGKKFSNKCKHSMKRTKDRIVPIRRRKQATLRFLRKDVADLITNGLQTNAFGRIEALIVETNHTSCYDMIEQYCECISNQLPSLQKERECPQEAREAVSTLVFAAARFPDLPELCDLRRVFTERYGVYLETSVSAEFVEKIQKKSFSTDKKLWLMQDIAHEFSVTWDCQAFEQKMSNSTAPAVDRLKKGTHICNGNNGASHVSNARKRADIDVEIPGNGSFEATPRSIDQKLVQPEPRDIHVVSSISIVDRVEKTRKVFSDGPEIVEQKGNQNGRQKDSQLPDGVRRSRSPLAQEGPGLIGLAREAVKAVESRDERAANMVPPPYTKPKGSKTQLDKGHTCDRSPRAVEEGLDPGSQEGGRPIRPVNSNNDRPVYMIPPYVKPKAHDRSNGGEDKDNLKDELLVDAKPKPVSVRRKHTKPPAVSEFDSVTDDAKLVSRTPSGHRRQGDRRSSATHNDDYDEGEKIRDTELQLPVSNEIDAADCDRLVNRTPSGRRRNVGRRTAATNYGGDCEEDEEERIMDKLLVHYSKKGVENESRKMGTRTRARPAELDVDDAKGAEHHIDGNRLHARPMGSVNPPGRAVSLPPEAISPNEAVKGPARAASMHPDALSANGVRAHPRLPDYDELAARLIALRHESKQ